MIGRRTLVFYAVFLDVCNALVENIVVVEPRFRDLTDLVCHITLIAFAEMEHQYASFFQTFARLADERFIDIEGLLLSLVYELGWFTAEVLGFPAGEPEP